MLWRVYGIREIMRPQLDYEGANTPLIPSLRIVAYGQVNQLRDPYALSEGGEAYLFMLWLESQA
jgi:hypothetical protein